MDKKGIVVINTDLSSDGISLFKESGINTLGLHSLYQSGGVEGYLNWLMRDDTRDLLKRYEDSGIVIEHQLHAVDWLLPRSYFKLKPEWFRMNEQGVRTADWNFCPSNSDALSFIENSAYMLAILLNQKSHYYYIWSDDCLNSVCYCEKCRTLNGADRNLIIANCILKGLKRFDADARISFLAYQDSMDLPTVVPDKDVFLEFAPIDRNHFSRLDGSDEANVKTRARLEKLWKIFPRETTQILEYFLDVSLYCKWKREDACALNLDEERLRGDIKWYAEKGVGGITTFSGFIDKKWLETFGDGDVRLYGKVINEVSSDLVLFGCSSI